MKKALSFHFEKDKNQYIAARGQMRFLLAAYKKIKAADIQFKYNKYGKPYFQGSELFFNISHSRHLGLLAVSLHFPLGVDIEWKRPDFGGVEIAKRFFSPIEVKSLLSLAKDQQNEAFFNCWSRKEAYIKGQGLGLSIPLDQFDVSLTPSEPAKLLSTRHQPSAVNEWTLKALFPDPNYAGAIAVKAKEWKLIQFDEFDIGKYL